MAECAIPILTTMDVVEQKSVLPESYRADMADLRGLDITTAVLELIRRTSSRLPQDVIDALVKGRDAEEEGSRAFNTLNDMVRNILLADGHVTPLCQDTGHGHFLGAPSLRAEPTKGQAANPGSHCRGHQALMAAAKLRGIPFGQEQWQQPGSLSGRPSCRAFRGMGKA